MQGMASLSSSASPVAPFRVEAVCKSGCCPGGKGIAPERLLNLLQSPTTAEHRVGWGWRGRLYLGALLLGTTEENEKHEDTLTPMICPQAGA